MTSSASFSAPLKQTHEFKKLGESSALQSKIYQYGRCHVTILKFMASNNNVPSYKRVKTGLIFGTRERNLNGSETTTEFYVGPTA